MSNLQEVITAVDLEGNRKQVQKLIAAGRAVPGDLLFDLEVDDIPMLVKPIFPKVGLVGFFGSSDTGKSTFLRQFALAVSNGSQDFLGFKLNTVHNRVLYVTTEDDHYATSSFLRKQSNNQKENLSNIRFLFDSNDIIEILEVELNENPVDCVIIDAYSDVVRGDINQSNLVREFLGDFKGLAQHFECLIIFLHHSGKGKQNLPPSKDNVLGSQSFEAKIRLLIEFRIDLKSDDIRHLCIVKGNYIPTSEKNKSIALHLDNNMIFHNTGKRIDFQDLVSNDQKGAIHNPKIIEQVMQLSTNKKSTREIETILASENIKIGKSSVARIIKEQSTAKKLGLDTNDFAKEVLEEKVDFKKMNNSYLDVYLNI